MFDTHTLSGNTDLSHPATYSASPRDDLVLKELSKYKMVEIADAFEGEPGYKEYESFLEDSLKPLGLYRSSFLPKGTSNCYKISFRGEIVAIFRLTPVESSSIFHDLIPSAGDKRILEVNNVAVAKSFQGDLLLGIILKNCAVLSHLKGYEIVAGIVRREVLPFFVDFGTVPVHHSPLHLLGDEKICDYITYFLTDKETHLEYALARSYHYFHRKVTMNRIDADHARAHDATKVRQGRL